MEGIQLSVVHRREYFLECTRFNFTGESGYQATVLSVRNRLTESLSCQGVL